VSATQPPPSQYPPQPSYQQSPAPKPKSRSALYIVVAVVVVAALIGLSLTYYEYQPGNPLNPYKVRVTQVIWTQYNETTSLGTSPGFTRDAGKVQTVGLGLYCAPGEFIGPYSVNCGSGSVYILTAGFGVVSTNAPFEWPSGTSGSYATVFVNVSLPSGANYDGDLAIDLH
jgi:hypothetical protein